MSDEITTTFRYQISNGSFQDQFTVAAATFDQAAVGATSGVWVVGTSEENLSVGDVGTVGFLILRNLDSTNYVDYGMSDSGTMKALGRIKPGEFAFLRLKPGVTLRAQADTASCKVEYRLYED